LAAAALFLIFKDQIIGFVQNAMDSFFGAAGDGTVPTGS
jgi:hypothetical protein